MNKHIKKLVLLVLVGVWHACTVGVTLAQSTSNQNTQGAVGTVGTVSQVGTNTDSSSPDKEAAAKKAVADKALADKAVADKAAADKAAAKLLPNTVELGVLEYCLVLLPLLLHLLMLGWIWVSRMSLKDALDDKEIINQAAERQKEFQVAVAKSLVTTQQANTLKELSTTNIAQLQGVELGTVIAADSKRLDKLVDNIVPPATGGAAPPVTSVSRLIVFLSGYASISISTALASFVIYRGLKAPTSQLPDLTGLLTLLLSLGIGIVPYAVNRFTSAPENPKS